MTSSRIDLTSLCIAGACAGDGKSRDRLVERFTPVLLAQARFRMSRPIPGIEPEDIVQDCWASALPQLRNLAPRDGGWTPMLLKFLSVILLRRVNDHLRRHVRRRGADAGVGGRDTDQHDPMDAVPAEVTGIVSRLARQHRECVVQQQIANLPDDERRVLLLRGIEQLPNREVARQLGVDDATVTRRYQKALERLRQSLPESIFAEL
ncbi:MAG: sigma-70 family RNA polymerase sigma factor [Planctomycetes bacterium]|nr:sigma-70 family RNA polymerase sigma factor [Planctomycetota bacterium]